MAGKSTFLEAKFINRMLRRLTTAVNGANASVSSILVTSSTGFTVGDIVQLTTPGSYHLVTSIPDATHIGITPNAAAAPTTGNVIAVAYLPSTVYVALLTAAPTDAGGGTEVAGGAYARQQLVQADGTWAAPAGSPSATSNSGVVTFPAPTANWGVITHFALYDALTVGNLLWWAALAVSKTVNNGDAAPSFAIGALSFTED